MKGGLASRLLLVTSNRESAADVASQQQVYPALIVITAGPGAPTRRAEDEPFIALSAATTADTTATTAAAAGAAASTADGQAFDGEAEEREEAGEDSIISKGKGSTERGEHTDGIAAAATAAAAAVGGDGHASNSDGGGGGLPGVLSLLSSSVGPLEAALGRRLFPIRVAAFERSAAGGPYAIFDAASGQLLLDAALLRDTWGWGRGSYGQPGSGPAVHRPEVPYIAGQLGQRLFKQLADMVAAAAAAGNGKSSSGDGGGGIADGGGLHGGMYDGLYDSEDLAAVLAAAGGGSEAGPSSSSLAVALVGAALAVALPAAFAAAPPLWFCVLCPTLLGLLAPIAINLLLNQIAGALCSQLQLTDDQCFDVLLGALGAGFALSLASAVPIFFVCRLPQCAGRNTTSMLARVAGRIA